MFEQANSGEPRNALADWFIRGGIGLAFVVFGMEKFQTDTMWPQLFQKVGMGQWFRYFTGWVEILGGVLVFLPWTVSAGLALLAATMASAALILIFVLRQPGDAVFSTGFCLALTAFWLTRRSTSSDPRR